MLSRVAANYAGLFSNLVIGIFLVRELIRVLGEDGFGLVSLFGMTVGVGIMIQDIVRQTMIRELGAAYHRKDVDFKSIQACAFGVVTIACIVACMVFTVFWSTVPLFSIPENLIGPGQWFIVAKAIQCICFTLAAPLFNLFVITERMFLANLFVVNERFMLLLSILGVGLISELSTGQKVVIYGFASCAAASFTYLSGAVLITIIDRKTRPQLNLINTAGVKHILKNSIYQGSAITAVNLHVRIGAFIVNLFVGLSANLVYGLGLQFASYIRQAAAGMTLGLDAVATRFSVGSAQQDVRWLVRRSTQMHAAVIFPVAAFALLFSSDLIELWVGDILKETNPSKHLLIPMIFAVAIGISARALSDAWIQILYGAGKIKTYIFPLVIASACNPVLAIIVSILLPAKWAGLGPPIAMSILFLTIHCGWIGRIAHKELGAHFVDLITPLIGPCIGTAIAVLATCLFLLIITADHLIQITTGGFIFGLTYVGYCFWGILTNQHRKRIYLFVKQTFSL